MIRLEFYPKYIGDNEYIELFYKALAPLGVVAEDNLYVRRHHLRDQPNRPDVIHFQWCPERLWRGDDPPRLGHLRNVVGVWRYLRLAKRLGIRVIWTVHDLVHHDHARRHVVDAWGYRVLARAADLVICHSDQTRGEVIAQYGARPASTVVMPIGNYDGVYPPPGPRVETLRDLGIPAHRKTLVCFGMARPYKGLDVAIEALRRLPPDYHLVIVGLPLPPAYGDSLRAAAEGMSNVTLNLDRVSHQQLADIVEAADCVLLPYRRITGSSALLATLTLGRGVVASDLAFFSDVLRGEPLAGVLCRPGDPADLARAVAEFFSGPVAERHTAARRLADQYDWGTVIRPVAEWVAKTFPDRVSGAALCH